jgi:hypothetical protein
MLFCRKENRLNDVQVLTLRTNWYRCNELSICANNWNAAQSKCQRVYGMEPNSDNICQGNSRRRDKFETVVQSILNMRQAVVLSTHNVHLGHETHSCPVVLSMHNDHLGHETHSCPVVLSTHNVHLGHETHSCPVQAQCPSWTWDAQLSCPCTMSVLIFRQAVVQSKYTVHIDHEMRSCPVHAHCPPRTRDMPEKCDYAVKRPRRGAVCVSRTVSRFHQAFRFSECDLIKFYTSVDDMSFKTAV